MITFVDEELHIRIEVSVGLTYRAVVHVGEGRLGGNPATQAQDSTVGAARPFNITRSTGKIETTRRCTATAGGRGQ